MRWQAAAALAAAAFAAGDFAAAAIAASGTSPILSIQWSSVTARSSSMPSITRQGIFS